MAIVSKRSHIGFPVLLGTCGHWRSLWELARDDCLAGDMDFWGCTYPFLR